MINKKCSLTLHTNVIGLLCVTTAFSSPAQAGGYSTNCSNVSGVNVHTWGNYHHSQPNYSNVTGTHGRYWHDFKTHHYSNGKHSDHWKSQWSKSSYSTDSNAKNHDQSHGKSYHNFSRAAAAVIW
jgi:hypothetical protein